MIDGYRERLRARFEDGTSVMTTRHERLQSLFICACDLPPTEQAAWLNQHCADDPKLRGELEELLRKDSAQDGILSDGHMTAGIESLPESMEFEMPEAIGPYRIKRVLGQGGMGVVYLAEQQNPRRDVAVKVIRPSIFNRELLKRFKTETTVLGLLQHPGIAQILEAGTATVRAAAGHNYTLPFFAMELVDGVPITNYAAANGLSTQQKLRLIVDTCQAVHSAHQRGVIHRDLKPGNMLVTKTGQVKLLDFGVARLVTPDQPAETVSTQFGQIVGTPIYMSPEQLEGNPDLVDTRSDVYSIGVVLYELLSQKLPHPVEANGMPEAIRQAKLQSPKNLSHFDPILRGDVETITEKALEGNVTRRYQSALDLAADIDRFLNNLPIEARPASTWYQIQKFAVRHRALVGGMVAVFAALLLGFVTTIWQASRVVIQRNAATAQAARASGTTDLLRRMIDAATPEKALGKEPTIRQMLDASSLELRTDNSIHPLVAADTHQILADAYFKLGNFELAAEHAEKASKLHIELTGANSADTLHDQMTLAMLLSRQDKDAEAISLARDALSRARQHLDPQHETLVALLNACGFTLSYAPNANQEEAVGFFRAAYKINEAKYGRQHNLTLRMATNLATTLLELKQLDEAEPLLREVYDVRMQQLGPEHPESLVAAYNMALLLCRKGQSNAATELARPQIELADRVLGSDHPSTLRLRVLVAHLEWELGHLDAAEKLLRDALTGAVSSLGPVHEDTLRARGSLANVLIANGRREEAEPLALEQHQLCLQKFGSKHQDVFQAITLLFDLAEARGDIEEMDRWARELRGSEWEKPALDAVEAARAKAKKAD
jgi:eukaryotic-like serine/threonine-protein kinase